MIKKSSFFLFFILIFTLINPVNAVSSLTNVYAMSLYNANGYADLYYGNAGSDWFIYLEGGSPNNIVIADYLTGTSYTIGYGNASNNPLSVFCDANGNIYYGTSSGVYKLRYSAGIQDTGDPSDYIYVSGDTYVNAWCEDSSYVYYSKYDAKNIKYISKSTGLTGSFMTVGDAYNDDIQSIFVDSDDLWTATIETNSDDVFITKTTSGTFDYSKEFSEGDSNNYNAGYLEQLDDGTFLFYCDNYASTGSDNIYLITDTGSTVTYSDTGLDIAISTTNRYTRSGNVAALGRNNNVLAYVYNNNILFSEVGYTPAFTGAETTVPATFNYEKSLCAFNYISYYNNSDIEVSYNIVTQNLNETQIDNFKENYKFSLELIDNNNAYVQKYTIQGNYFYEKTYYESWADYLTGGDTYLYKTGTFSFSNNENWDSGTYKLKLYEINEISGDTALLDTDTSTVLDTAYNGTVEINPDTDSFSISDLSTKMLETPYFWVGLFIIVFGGAGAYLSGAVGFAIGAFVGVCISVALELIGAWMILAIIIVAIFALAFFKS